MKKISKPKSNIASILLRSIKVPFYNLFKSGTPRVSGPVAIRLPKRTLVNEG